MNHLMFIASGRSKLCLIICSDIIKCPKLVRATSFMINPRMNNITACNKSRDGFRTLTCKQRSCKPLEMTALILQLWSWTILVKVYRCSYLCPFGIILYSPLSYGSKLLPSSLRSKLVTRKWFY